MVEVQWWDNFSDTLQAQGSKESDPLRVGWLLTSVEMNDGFCSLSLVKVDVERRTAGSQEIQKAELSDCRLQLRGLLDTGGRCRLFVRVRYLTEPRQPTKLPKLQFLTYVPSVEVRVHTTKSRDDDIEALSQ
jgi:hypothetical protein